MGKRNSSISSFDVKVEGNNSHTLDSEEIVELLLLALWKLGEEHSGTT